MHQLIPKHLSVQGQGASQAIEDAITLAEILPIGQTTPADIPERLRLYQSARRSRVEQIQVVSRGFGKGTLREIKEKSRKLVPHPGQFFCHLLKLMPWVE